MSWHGRGRVVLGFSRVCVLLCVALWGCQRPAHTRIFACVAATQPATGSTTAPGAAPFAALAPSSQDDFEPYERAALTARGPGPITERLTRLQPFDDRSSPPLVIDFIRIGQGDCTLVSFPNGQRLLVDCGSTIPDVDLDSVRTRILSMLDPDAPTIDALVITHPDSDHYQHLAEVLAGVTVGTCYAVDEPDAHSVNNTEEWLEERFPRSRYKILKRDQHEGARPKRLHDFGASAVYVLAANVDEAHRTNSAKNARSIVLKVTYGDFDCLLTGDATYETEDFILRRFAGQDDFLDVEVLKIAHHGSLRTSTQTEFLGKIKPEAAVVSCADPTDRYGHPRKEVIDRVAVHTLPADPHPFTWHKAGDRRRVLETVTNFDEAIYSTEDSGHVRVITNGGQFQVIPSQN